MPLHILLSLILSIVVFGAHPAHSAQYQGEDFSLALPEGWSEMTPAATRILTNPVPEDDMMPWQKAFSPTPDRAYVSPFALVQRIVSGTTHQFDLPALNQTLLDLLPINMPQAQLLESTFYPEKAVFLMKLEVQMEEIDFHLDYVVNYTNDGFIQMLGYRRLDDTAAEASLQLMYDSFAVAADRQVREKQSATEGAMEGLARGLPVIALAAGGAMLVAIVIWLPLRKRFTQ